jgi:hypothetical protein
MRRSRTPELCTAALLRVSEVTVLAIHALNSSSMPSVVTVNNGRNDRELIENIIVQM